MNGPRRERILVIRHGALGDFVLSTGAFLAIRRHHPDADIVLLTTMPYVDLALASGCFDEVWADPRPKLWQVGTLLALARRFRRAGFARVYDLQTSNRSSLYLQLFPPWRRPEWSGIARGASHPDDNPDRRSIHTIERQRHQLYRAGIADVPDPDLSWVQADITRFRLPATYALMVPGGSAHRPEKRWPPERYADMAQRLASSGLPPVIVGAEADRAAVRTVAVNCTAAIDLCGETDLLELTAIAAGARFAIGNDTGPMHVAAAAGAPSVVLFSGASDPRRTAPRGPAVTVVQRQQLAALSVDEVWRYAAHA